MPVFTGIAAAIAGAIGLTAGTLAFTIVTSIIRIGLGVLTNKILGLALAPKAGKDPGVKIQLPPGTDNKVPRLYGRNFAGGTLIDAQIKNANKTMGYVLVFSEYNGAIAGLGEDTWTVNRIFRNDAELVFGTGADSHKVQSLNDPNSTSSTKVKNKIRVRVYAGGADAAYQIFPVQGSGDVVNARSMFTAWTTANTMTDLVFAIVEIDYDPENGLTGLDQFTLDITNSKTKPLEVFYDYLTNARYGAGLTVDQFDYDSIYALGTYSDEMVDYRNASNVTVTHPRYRIDGGLSTFSTVAENINQLCLATGSFFAYNNKLGKFQLIVNRAATSGELANAFVFNDYNITSSIQISSTDLFSLYNQVEVEFPSQIQNDQTDTITLDIDPALRNPQEPDNEISYRLDLVNHRARAGNLGLIELRQSRLNTVLQFTADYSAMQVNVGEVVKVTQPLYGWTDKLFRVMRTTEVEDSEGMLSVDVLLLEYDASVYTHVNLQQSTPKNASGIDSWWVVNGNASPVFGNVVVVDNPASGNANVISGGNGSVIGNFPVDSIDSTVGGINESLPYIQFSVAIPDGTAYNQMTLSARNMDTGAVTQSLRTYYPETETYFIGGTTEKVYLDAMNITSGANLQFEVQLTDTVTGVSSRTANTANISTISIVNAIPNAKMAPYGAGAQFEQTGMVANAMANSSTFSQLTDAFTYNIRGINLGKYSFTVGGVPTGTIASGATQSVGIRANGNITYANATTSNVVLLSSPGIRRDGIRSIPTYITDNQEVIIDAVAVGLASDQVPVSMNVWVDAYSTLTNTTVARGMEDISYRIFKIANETSFDRIGVYTPPPTQGGGSGGFDPGDGPLCLLSGQTVILADGNTAIIDDVIVGDQLKSFAVDGLPLVSDDPDVLNTWRSNVLTGNADVATVVSITQFETPTYVLINGWLKTTPSHRHLVYRDGEWQFVQAKYVLQGDLMRHVDGSDIAVESVAMRFVASTAYKMDVEDLDVFYVGNVLTHNVKAQQ